MEKIERWAIKWSDGHVSFTRYRSEDAANRAIAELVEAAFGDEGERSADEAAYSASMRAVLITA